MPSNQPIFDAIVNFFTQDNWSFTQIKKQSALRLRFQHRRFGQLQPNFVKKHQHY